MQYGIRSDVHVPEMPKTGTWNSWDEACGPEPPERGSRVLGPRTYARTSGDINGVSRWRKQLGFRLVAALVRTLGLVGIRSALSTRSRCHIYGQGFMARNGRLSLHIDLTMGIPPMSRPGRLPAKLTP
jgi:hypothetical protein